MSATAIQPSKSSEGAGVVDGVINWGRETAADLWQSRKFTTPHIIANLHVINGYTEQHNSPINRP